MTSAIHPSTTAERMALDRKREQNANERANKFGPPPINPFTLMRQRLGLSHEELGKRALCSKQALIRLEQGTFARPLPSVLDWYVANHGYSELAICDEYEQFQSDMRARYRQVFGPTLECDVSLPIHPFRQLRQVALLNPTEVAKGLCMPQATITHFEKNWNTQKSVPKALLEILREIGYSQLQVYAFEKTYRDWRRLHKIPTVRFKD